MQSVYDIVTERVLAGDYRNFPPGPVEVTERALARNRQNFPPRPVVVTEHTHPSMMTMHPPLTRDLAPVVDSEPKHEVAAIEPVKVTAHWKRRAIVAFVVACNGAINFGELPVGVRVVSWALVVLFAFIALAQP